MDDVPSQPATGREFDLADPIRSFLDTTIAVVRQPARFFAQVPTNAGFLNPLIYSVACIAISTGLAFLAFQVLGLPSFGSLAGLTQSPTGRPDPYLLGDIIVYPLGLLIGAAITHVGVRIVLGHENSGYQATFRLLAYSSALLLLEWLPFVGWIIGLYSIYVWIVGLREVHRTTTGQAIGITLLPALVIVPLFCIVVFVSLSG